MPLFVQMLVTILKFEAGSVNDQSSPETLPFYIEHRRYEPVEIPEAPVAGAPVQYHQ
jgi:hypothetical protein